MLLPGHDAALGASKEWIFVKFENWWKKVKNLGKWLKKGCQKFCEMNRKYLLRNLFEKIWGHPRTSLVPGIQQPLLATGKNPTLWSLTHLLIGGNWQHHLVINGLKEPWVDESILWSSHSPVKRWSKRINHCDSCRFDPSVAMTTRFRLTVWHCRRAVICFVCLFQLKWPWKCTDDLDNSLQTGVQMRQSDCICF